MPTILERLDYLENTLTSLGVLSGIIPIASNIRKGKLGNIPYQTGYSKTEFIPPNRFTDRRFLSMLGTGSEGAVPEWKLLTLGDLTDLDQIFVRKTLYNANTVLVALQDNNPLPYDIAALGGGGSVSDIAYAASWDGIVDVAPSKNAVYDEMELRAPKASPTFSGDVVITGLSSCVLMAEETTGHIRVLNLGAGLSLNLTTSTLTGVLPPGCFSGGLMTHAAEVDHDITIAPFSVRDDTDTADIVLPSALTKQTDADWAAGTNAGGRDAGTVPPASGTIHVWAIKSASTGVVDALLSVSATAPTMPANYDYKRLIGSYRTNSSSNIIPGDWVGTSNERKFIFDTRIFDIDIANPGTNAVLGAVSSPGGVITEVELFGYAYGGTSLAYWRLSSPQSIDIAPAAGLVGNDVTNIYQRWFIQTNTSNRVRYRFNASGALDTLKLATISYKMFL